jgi:hypothetical protein
MAARIDKVGEKAAKELEKIRAGETPAEMEKELDPHNVVCKIKDKTYE